MPKKKTPAPVEPSPDNISAEVENGVQPGADVDPNAQAPDGAPDGAAPDDPPDGALPDGTPCDDTSEGAPDSAAPDGEAFTSPPDDAPDAPLDGEVVHGPSDGDAVDGLPGEPVTEDPADGQDADAPHDEPILLDDMAAEPPPMDTPEAEDGDGLGALFQEMGSSAPLVIDQGSDPLAEVLQDAPPVSDEAAAPAQDMAETPDAPREAPAARNATPPAGSTGRDDYVLTIEARSRIETDQDREDVIWHEIRNSHITGRILTGTLDGVEQTESGLTLAIIDYKGFRVAIPLKEMMLHTGKMPYGREYVELMERLNRILVTMLGCEIDFIVRGVDNASRSVVASRKAAMLRKRQTFYMDTNDLGEHMIYEGRVVQARVVGVAEKVLRVEVFGVECAIFARDLSTVWFGDAREQYSVGDRVLVRVQTIERPDVEHITITADVRSVSSSTSHDNLRKLVVQSRYAGRVTDVRSGVVYIRLNNGCNAIAHTCYDRRTPGKNDDVSFAVTRLDVERGIALGIITRIIRQNL